MNSYNCCESNSKFSEGEGQKLGGRQKLFPTSKKRVNRIKKR